MIESDQFTMIERERIVALSQSSLHEDSNDAGEARDYLFNTRKISSNHEKFLQFTKIFFK
jgi:hypothetical protein